MIDFLKALAATIIVVGLILTVQIYYGVLGPPYNLTALYRIHRDSFSFLSVKLENKKACYTLQDHLLEKATHERLEGIIVQQILCINTETGKEEL